jgi:CBS-domain-containing membrane protein
MAQPVAAAGPSSLLEGERAGGTTPEVSKAPGTSAWWSFQSSLRGLRTPWEALCDGVFGAVGIGVLCALNSAATRAGLLQLLGSFGASAVLVFACPAVPLAQPRNVVCGNVLSALVGVAFGAAARACAPQLAWLFAGLAVGGSISLMGLFGVLHPPAGATALIAVVGGADVATQGCAYCHRAQS